MKRWASNLFCLFSLLIFATSVALWVRSLMRSERVTWYIDRTDYSVRLPLTRYNIEAVSWADGRVAFFHASHEFAHWVQFPRGLSRESLAPGSGLYLGSVATNMRSIGFGPFIYFAGESSDNTASMTDTTVVLPLWLFLIFAVPPILWLRKRRKNRGRGFPIEAGESSQHPVVSSQ